jgi:CHASE3 domain sensor protein
MFPLSRRLFFTIVAIQIILLFVVGLSLRQFIAVSDRINAGNHLLVAVDSIGQTILNAETGQRGYLLTGDTEYLHPYNTAQITLPDQLAQLNSSMSLIDRHHPRVDRVTVLAKAKMVELQKTIQTARDGSLEKAIAEVKTNRGKEIMDELRVLLAEIITRQTERLDTYQKHLKLYGFAMLSGLMTICGLGALFVRRLPPEDGPEYSR